MNNIDNKAKKYLDRAEAVLMKYDTLRESFTYSEIIEVAKMIQLEELNQSDK